MGFCQPDARPHAFCFAVSKYFLQHHRSSAASLKILTHPRRGFSFISLSLLLFCPQRQLATFFSETPLARPSPHRMLRSQSISNLHDRKSNSFLSSFRTKSKPKPSSSTELTRHKISGPLDTRHRPLSQSASSLNLGQNYSDNLSSAGKQRVAASNVADKENASSIYQLHRASIAAPSNSATNTRTLKTRSSAPNLKSTKRQSMFFGTFSHATPPMDILADSSSIADEDDHSFNDDLQYSPFTPDDYGLAAAIDPIHDVTPICIDPDFEEDYIIDTGVKRKTPSHNINDFAKLIDESDTTPRLAMNNRKSLEFEALERSGIRESMQRSMSREDKSWITTLNLVENVIFIGLDSGGNAMESLLGTTEDYMAALKDEPYHYGEELAQV